MSEKTEVVPIPGDDCPECGQTLEFEEGEPWSFHSPAGDPVTWCPGCGCCWPMNAAAWESVEGLTEGGA